MTVAELIAELSKQDPNATVEITWEGTTHTIEPKNIYAQLNGTVFLDGDDNVNKRNWIDYGQPHQPDGEKFDPDRYRNE